jgi:hypothetical protein
MSAAEDALRARIAAAFSGEPPAPLVERMLLAAYRSSDDAFEMAQAFAGRRWTDLSVEELFYHREMVVTLSAEAYRAILPAYLTAALIDDRRHGGDLREFLVFGLAPLSSEPLDVDSTRERLSGLAPVQRDAVRAVLTYLVDHRGMTEAADVLREW